MDAVQGLLLVGAAGLAGMVNSVAGGGTLLTFPTLLWVLKNSPDPFIQHNAPLIANATSSVALLPGALSSLWGYRDELNQSKRALAVLILPSLVGGIIGAMLLVRTPPGVFSRIVPFLILLATLLFMAQEPLSRWQRARAARSAQPVSAPAVEAENAEADLPAMLDGQEPPPVSVAPSETQDETFRTSVPVVLFQLFVAVYGGYFGAGIGIMMLAALGLMGFTNIHRMNGLKNINGFSVNVVACLLFAGKGLVNVPIAGMMAVGAILGGYFGAGTARRIGQKNVRRIIIGIGFALTLSLLLKH